MNRQEFIRKWCMRPNLEISPGTPMLDVSNQLIADLEKLELKLQKDLLHYHDTTVGLFVTDVPEKLAKRLYDLAIQNKNNERTGIIMLENELTIGKLTWQLNSIYENNSENQDPNQLEVDFEEITDE